jgi:hypothetical protein
MSPVLPGMDVSKSAEPAQPARVHAKTTTLVIGDLALEIATQLLALEQFLPIV